MSWNPNIPNATDLISTSQDQIKQNFQALDPLFTSSGNFLLLPVQAGQPTTSSTQLVLYSFLSPNTGQIELYMGRPSSATPPIQISGGASGWAFLPSGQLMKWGTGSFTNPSGEEDFAFPVSAAIPVFKTGTIPFVTLGNYGNVIPAEDTDTYVRLVRSTNLLMTVWCSQRTNTTQNAGIYNWSWMAIGLPN